MIIYDHHNVYNITYVIKVYIIYKYLKTIVIFQGESSMVFGVVIITFSTKSMDVSFST